MSRAKREARTVVLRATVCAADAAALRAKLEPMNDPVWIAPTLRAERHTLWGVPAKYIDVAVCDLDGHGQALIEVVRKRGKFDGAVRDRIVLRPPNGQRRRSDGAWVPSGDPMPPPGVLRVVEARTADGAVRNETTISVERWDGPQWSACYQVLRTALLPDESPRAIVMWHWSRYYSHLPQHEAEDVASTWQIPAGVSVAAAHRDASRALYAHSRALGWCKLTARERAQLRVDAQWVREETVAERRAALRGYRADGVSDATHEAAATGAWPDEETADGSAVPVVSLAVRAGGRP